MTPNRFNDDNYHCANGPATNHDLSSLLQSFSACATGPVPDSGYITPSPSPSTNTLGSNPTTTTAIHPSTNPASFRNLLGAHRAVVAMFTSATCPPCRMIEPVFEELERAKAKAEGQQVAFVKVGLGVGMGSAGVNAPELRTQVDFLLYQAFPRKLIFGCASNERYIDV